MIACELEDKMYDSFWLYVQLYYSENGDGNLIRIEEDEVIEVTTEEELKETYSSCFNYIGDFMRAYNAKKDLTSQFMGCNKWLEEREEREERLQLSPTIYHVSQL